MIAFKLKGLELAVGNPFIRWKCAIGVKLDVGNPVNLLFFRLHFEI
jgi:hypothetical protein